MKRTIIGRNRYFLLLAFIIPVIIVSASLAALHILPFGHQTLVLYDASSYYIPFLSYAKAIIHGEHGLLYSFSQSIGGGIVGTIWPYLLNPFSWIIAFFEYEQYPLAYSLGVILMNGIYGLVMFLFLADKYGRSFSCLLISTIYALCGFNIVFLVNTAFFCGGPLFLPLMALGQRKILRGESPLLYMASIAWSLVLQVQMGFTICMASLLFFLAECWLDKDTIKHCGIRFTLASLFAGLLSAFLLLPEMHVFLQGRGTMSLEDFSVAANAPLLEMASRFFTGANSASQIISGYPAVFCGILPIALAVLFFMDKQIRQRKKSAFAALLIIYALGFYIRFFTSVYQGFTHANWFNFRFSFVFTFLMLDISMEELRRMEHIPLKRMATVGVGILLSSLIIFCKTYECVDGAMMVLDLALLAIMGGGFWFYKARPEKASKNTLILLFCACSFLQLYINSYICTKRVSDVWQYEDGEYVGKIMKKEPLITAIKSTDQDFYRIESESKLVGGVGNDGLFLGYSGVGYAGHTERYFVSAALGRLGLDYSNGCWNSYDPGVPAALDSLLGIKYVISARNLEEEKDYSKRIELFGEAIYENEYALPIVNVCNDSLMNVSIKDENDVFVNLNAVWRAMVSDSRDIFSEENEITFSSHNSTDTLTMRYLDVGRDSESGTEGDLPVKDTGVSRNASYIEYTFTSRTSGPVYLYDSAAIIEGFGSLEDLLQYVGCFSEGETVTGRLYLDRIITEQVMADTLKGLHICYADMDLLKEYSDLIRSRSATIVKESDSHLSGEATLEEGQRLLFTIPFDEGWTLIVDGEEVPLEKTADLFMSASMGAGTHHYELVFWPVGLTAGIAVSIFALLGLIALSIISKNHRKNHYVTETSDGKPADGIVSELDQESPKRDTTETAKPDGSSTESA